MNELDGVINEFLVESCENLDRLDSDLVALEVDPSDKQRISSIFRAIHTIKGTCGFFGFSRLEAVTHVGENLLSRLRDGEIVLNEPRASVLLQLVDAVRQMLAQIEQSGTDGDDSYPGLIDALQRLQEDESAAPSSDWVDTLPDPPAYEQSVSVEEPTETPAEQLVESSHVAAVDLNQTVLEQAVGAVSELQDSRSPAAADTCIRVDVGLLDKLMNLVGELVLARNQILQVNGSHTSAAFQGASQRLNLITSELQENVMKTRMQPIGNVWNRFPRIVRDLAVSCGKQVRLEVEGQETELDKTIIEAIKDPLTHIIRNSVDHGIEAPAKRLAANKPESGTLKLRAFHEGGQVNIEIIDDGGGIDPEKVKRKAVERGLVTRDQAERLADRDAIQLIFAPGFSTAEQVTNVSGRGVGMDVVRTNIEKIGGTVDVQTQVGYGTTLKIKIPLTLAIIPALIVMCGKERFAIPQVNLLELLRLDTEQSLRGIEMIHGAPVYRLRGQLLPLLYLDQELRLTGEGEARKTEGVNLIVLQADDRQFGLLVDAICDTEEIVVKPLGKQISSIPVFAGATIMGDGRVALILDVLGIAQRGGVISEVRDRQLAELSNQRPQREANDRTYLLVAIGRSRYAAIPLSAVSRLEEIPHAQLEWADRQEVVQYRGQILPLVRLADVLHTHDDNEESQLQVVVYSEGKRSVGLIVSRIIDIVETDVEVQPSRNRSGILGSAVIQNRVTDLLDVRGLLESVGCGLEEFSGSLA